MGKFFKGFFLCLLWVLIIVACVWILSFLFDLAAAAWGYVFGFGFWSIILLVICIIAGIVYMRRDDI